MANNPLANQDEFVRISRKELEALHRRCFELEALKSLSDRLANVFEIKEAIKIFNSYLIDVLDFSSAAYFIINPELDRGFLYLNYLNEDVGEKFVADIHDDITRYIEKKKIAEAEPVISRFKQISPIQFGRKISGAKDMAARSRLVFPLNLAGRTLGVIHLASTKKKLERGEGGWLTEAMIVTFELFLVRLQAIMQSQRSRTESLVASLSDGIIMFDSRMKVVLVNRPASRYTGLKQDNGSLAGIYPYFPGFDLESRLIEMLITARIIRLSDIIIKDRHYEIYCTPVKDNQGRVVAGAIIMHDITRLKEIDQMKTDFVYIASHQLRTPLTGIRWFIQLLKKDLDARGNMSKRQAECLEQIAVSNDLMIKLVNDLLNVSRLETGKKFKIEKTKIDLNALIRQVKKDNIAILNNKKIKLSVSSRPKKITFRADEQKIRQVVHNLVNNAIKYSPKNGRVEIKALAKAGGIRLSVADQGIGIPKEEQGRIFEKFFRANNANSEGAYGSGLGLYLAKAIVGAHGGKFGFSSREGRGTTFYFTLPDSAGKK